MTGNERDVRQAHGGSVTDPAWEDVLRAGMESDPESGASGSVEPELAVARLLLHAGAPAELGEARRDAVWREIDGALTPIPWWRRRAWVWGAPALAAASAVVLVVMLQPGRPPPTSPLAAAPGQAIAVQLEGQFAMLAPAARADVARSVDTSRGSMRGTLLAMAQDAETIGGAP